MKRAFFTIIAFVFLCCPLLTNAQKRVETDVQLDLVTRHMWRGQDYGKISLQPQGSIKYQGFYLSGFGSTGFSEGDINRIDISLGYQAPFGLNIGVSDNFKSGSDKYGRYFTYEEKTTGHRFEGNLGFSCKYFSLQGYCIFMGNDFKLNGDRAYELARKGSDHQLEPKQIRIDGIELMDFDPEKMQLQIRVSCGKGTYIRSLARDIGEALGSGAHLTALCRTRVGDVRLEDCLTFDEFPAWMEEKLSEE